MLKRRNFEEWEKAFVRLTYPTYPVPEIAKHLNRSNGTIRYFLHKCLKLKKPEQVRVGDIFGLLEVKEYLGKSKKHGSKWKCMCKCGKYTEVASNTLTSGHSKSCGCERIKRISFNPDGLVSGKLFGQIRRGAKQRDIEFNITIDEVEDLLKKQEQKCALTGLPIFIDTKRVNYECQQTTASLDRIDSKDPYNLSNIQWLHKDVNYMKVDYDEDYFIFICHLVARHKKCPVQFQQLLDSQPESQENH